MGTTKITIALSTIVLLAAVVVAAIMMWNSGKAPANLSAMPPAAPPETAPAAPETFDQVYSLAGDETLRRVRPPFSDARLDFYRTQNPTQAAAIPAGPNGMLVKWDNGVPTMWGTKFGGGYSPEELIGFFGGFSKPAIEDGAGIKSMELDGDWAVRTDATPEQFRATLGKIISDELGEPVTLTVAEVERPVIIIKGAWHFTSPRPRVGRGSPFPSLDLYGADLGPESSGGGGSGTIPEFSAALSDYIGQQVIIEAAELPPQVIWRYNTVGNGTPQSASKARDAELVLSHVDQQTGLSHYTENRKSQRLIIERRTPAPSHRP
jgi:hypothetical protein